MTDLGTLGGSSSDATGINDSGQVVGDSWLSTAANSGRDAFLYSGGSMTDLGTLGGDSYATGINDSGQVVGHLVYPTDQGFHAFLYSSGSMTDLGTGLISCATGINDSVRLSGRFLRREISCISV